MTLEKTQNYLIVKIPLKSVKMGEADISPRHRRIIDKAISEGLTDIRKGRIFGSFKSVKEFKTSLQK